MLNIFSRREREKPNQVNSDDVRERERDRMGVIERRRDERKKHVEEEEGKEQILIFCSLIQSLFRCKFDEIIFDNKTHSLASIAFLQNVQMMKLRCVYANTAPMFKFNLL